jgi:hypothetical protein
LPPREDAGVFLGLGVGLLLGGLYYAYDQALLHWRGPPDERLAYWHCLASAGWNIPPESAPWFWRGVEPHWLVTLSMFIVGVGVPLVQQLYFRGLQSMWWGNGLPRAGAVVSTLLGSLFILDWYYLPIALLAGGLFAWLYAYTRTGLAPVIAHLLLNACVIAVIFGLLPLTKHPVNLLPGRWEADQPTRKVGDVTVFEAPQPMRFYRGGWVDDGRYRTDGLRHSYYPQRYRWIGPDTIRIRFQHSTLDHDKKTILNEVFHADYQVGVGTAELTLTPVDGAGPPGLPTRYHRKF